MSVDVLAQFFCSPHSSSSAYRDERALKSSLSDFGVISRLASIEPWRVAAETRPCPSSSSSSIVGKLTCGGSAVLALRAFGWDDCAV